MNDHMRDRIETSDDGSTDASIRTMLAARAARADEWAIGPDAAAARLEGRLAGRGAGRGALRLAVLAGTVLAALAVPLIAGQLDRDPYAPPEAGVSVDFPSPASLVAAFGSVWVAGPDATELGRIDPTTGAVQRIPLAAPACGALQATDAAIWIVHCGGVPFATRLEPEGLGATRLSGVASRNVGLSGGLVVIPGDDGRSVTALDATTFEQRWRTDVGGEVRAFASRNGSVWAIDEQAGRVHMLDGVTGRIATTVEVSPAGSTGAGLRAGAASDEALWLVHEGELRVYRVDAATGTVSEPIDVGMVRIEGADTRPDHQVVVVDGVPWVRLDEGMIARLHPLTGQVADRVPGGVGGGGFAVTPQALWSASYGADQVVGQRR